MLASETLNNNILTNHVNEDAVEIANQELVSESGSELSLSDKIIIESNEKRLRRRLDTLQTSIINLKEQLSLEKELWREDLEKIKYYQRQQEINRPCPIHRIKPKEIFSICDAGRSVSTNSLLMNEICTCKRKIDCLYNYSTPLHYIELENYKQKIAETELMCNTELNRLKQNLQDLNHLKQFTAVWKDEPTLNNEITHHDDSKNEQIEEIFISQNNNF